MRTFAMLGLGALLALGAASCRFDPSYRDYPDPAVELCSDGLVQCRGPAITRCEGNKPVVVDDCGARGLACAPALIACTPCLPQEITCAGQDLVQCDVQGQVRNKVKTCDATKGEACRRDACVNLCAESERAKSNIGCEYWPVDLDNAVTNAGNAALQQYAVIVSNPQPDVVAVVTIEEDIAKPGEPANIRTVAQANVNPQQLEVFRLGPKEVDGSEVGKPNSGTGTALSRGAYRIRSNVPIVAYQFNPLDNANVFSNDASLLLPTQALGRSGQGRSYVVASWPQTIAPSDIPALSPFRDHLRTFLTIVGIVPDTKVHLKTTARVVPGGPFEKGIPKDGEVDVTLQPFDVLNLETGDFNADFTGTTVESDQPIVVYVGSEASDAPFYENLSKRSCCADHLETQVVPLRAVGKRYAIGRMPNRSRAVSAAGAAVATFPEPELYRVVATASATRVVTSLDPPWDAFDLPRSGDNVVIHALRDFRLEADKPVLVADVQVSQEAAGITIANGLPGGDPSLLLVPPVEQWRSEYVLLTPDKYAFDFLVITAPNTATVFIDGLPADASTCEIGVDPVLSFKVYRCQLSFPIVNPAALPPNNVLPGQQNDGVHRVQADAPVGVLVYGFDYRVSYAYAGGTELVEINPN